MYGILWMEYCTCNGTYVGLAYVGTTWLSARKSCSVTQDMNSFLNNVIIIAHEIGHR